MKERERPVSLVYTYCMRVSLTKLQPASFSVFFLTLGDMTKTMPCFPKATHVNHLLGSCQQPKGFNGTVFWDLHTSSTFFERWRVSRGKGSGETSLSPTLKEDTSSAEKIAAPIFLSFPAVAFKCKLALSASLPEISASGN